jgi:hypothetical protein
MITCPNLEKSSPFISWMHGMVISSHPGTSRHLCECCRGVFWSKMRSRLLHRLQEFNLPCAAWRPGFPFVFAGDSTEDNDMPVPNA